jgi:hypothetical protein
MRIPHYPLVSFYAFEKDLSQGDAMFTWMRQPSDTGRSQVTHEQADNDAAIIDAAAKTQR